jgi:UDP-N-acetyl-D-glucosamine dehydrogenase
MKVSVVGQGYVGLTLAINAALAGHEVNGYDSNSELIQQLSMGETFIPGINKYDILNMINNAKYFPTDNPADISESEAVVIAVPTPLDEHWKPNLTSLEQAAMMIGKYAKNNALIINESTSYPGTLRDFIKPIIENASSHQFMFASAPERIDPANILWDISITPRLISGISHEAITKTFEFYTSICNEVTIVSSPEVAESAKLFENTFRQVNIALVNELSIITNKMGISAHEVVEAASTKPFGFMPFYPSIGVGGHCIPVDPSYLSYKAEKLGLKANFIDLANQLNRDMPKKVARKVQIELNGSLNNKRIQIVGVAYKSNVSDIRESPSLILINELEQLGAEVSWFDPLVGSIGNQKSEPLNSQIDLGLIVSPHSNMDFSLWKNSGIKVLDLSANNINYGWPKFL